MHPDDYQALVIREFARLKRLAEDAMAQVDDAGFFTRPGEGDNSIAVMVKHVGGNLLSRWTDFLGADGEKPDRRRDDEFRLYPADTRAALLARWEAGWAALFAALRPLAAADWARDVRIRGEALSVPEAVNRQLTHYAYHVGQIVYVAKHVAGANWNSLSIPLGRSEDFNRAPTRYRTDTDAPA